MKAFRVSSPLPSATSPTRVSQRQPSRCGRRPAIRGSTCRPTHRQSARRSRVDRPSARIKLRPLDRAQQVPALLNLGVMIPRRPRCRWQRCWCPSPRHGRIARQYGIAVRPNGRIKRTQHTGVGWLRHRRRYVTRRSGIAVGSNSRKRRRLRRRLHRAHPICRRTRHEGGLGAGPLPGVLQCVSARLVRHD
jgi:hypothetical protein